MNTPTLSLRVPPAQQQLVRDVVNRLKADPGFADALQAMLPQPAATVAAPSALAEVSRRLDDIERWIAAHGSIVTPEASSAPLDAIGKNVGIEAPAPIMREVAPIVMEVAPTAEEPASDQPARRRRGQPVPPEVLAEVDRRVRETKDSGVKIGSDLGVTASFASKRRRFLLGADAQP